MEMIVFDDMAITITCASTVYGLTLSIVVVDVVAVFIYIYDLYIYITMRCLLATVVYKTRCVYISIALCIFVGKRASARDDE